VRNLQLNFDQLVVGSCLDSLIYAYQNATPIILINPEFPCFFEKTKEGNKKADIYEKLVYLLGLAGLCPFSDKISTYEKENKNELKIIGTKPYSVCVKFTKLKDFYAKRNKELSERNSIYQVVDWCHVRSGAFHEFDTLIDKEDDFINQIYFFKSKRVDAYKELKDLVSVSYLTREQLEHVDYSEVYVRHKVVDMMTKAGIEPGHTKNIIVDPIKRDNRLIFKKEKTPRSYPKILPGNFYLKKLAFYLGDPFE
jgi:hypothetical protein